MSYTEAALAALNAGCDMVLLCNQSVGEGAGVDELLDGLAEAQLKGGWRPERERANARRSSCCRAAPALPWDGADGAPAYIHARGLAAALTIRRRVDQSRLAVRRRDASGTAAGRNSY